MVNRPGTRKPPAQSRGVPALQSRRFPLLILERSGSQQGYLRPRRRGYDRRRGCAPPLWSGPPGGKRSAFTPVAFPRWNAEVSARGDPVGSTEPCGGWMPAPTGVLPLRRSPPEVLDSLCELGWSGRRPDRGRSAQTIQAAGPAPFPPAQPGWLLLCCRMARGRSAPTRLSAYSVFYGPARGRGASTCWALHLAPFFSFRCRMARGRSAPTCLSTHSVL